MQRLIPAVREMRAEIDAEPEGLPDLLERSSALLRDIIGSALGDLPDWARPLAFGDCFGGDTNQATQFARGVPDFALKGRFADMVKLDLHALEQEMGFAVRRTGWRRRMVRR